MLSFLSRRVGLRKLHRRYTAAVFAFFMSGIMAFLMCLVITAANQGIHAGYFEHVIQAYSLAMPVAFICVLIVRPVVLKLVGLTVQQ